MAYEMGAATKMGTSTACFGAKTATLFGTGKYPRRSASSYAFAFSSSDAGESAEGGSVASEARWSTMIILVICRICTGLVSVGSAA